MLYGCRPNDNVPVITAPSPLLERLGLISDADRNAKEEDAVTAGEYVAARVKAVHGSNTYGTAPGTKFTHKNLEVLENFADTSSGKKGAI